MTKSPFADSSTSARLSGQGGPLTSECSSVGLTGAALWPSLPECEETSAATSDSFSWPVGSVWRARVPCLRVQWRPVAGGLHPR